MRLTGFTLMEVDVSDNLFRHHLGIRTDTAGLFVGRARLTVHASFNADGIR